MALMPLAAGLIIATPKTPSHIFLALAWISGFLLFSVSEKYIKSRFRPRYRAAVITYGVVAAAFTGALLVTSPHLLWWSILFAPLVGYWFLSVRNRKERELASRFSTIAAAALVLPVAVNAPLLQPWFTHFDTQSWLMAGLLGTYFGLTVPYVKTLIRERGRAGWLWGSIIGHVVATAIAVTLALSGWISLWHGLAWVVVCVRAALMPWLAKTRNKPWRPAVVGVLETVLSLLVFATLPWTL